MPSASRAWSQEPIYVLDRYKLPSGAFDYRVREISRMVIRYESGIDTVEFDGVRRTLRDKDELFPRLKGFREAGRRVVLEYEGGWNFPLNKRRLRWISTFELEEPGS